MGFIIYYANKIKRMNTTWTEKKNKKVYLYNKKKNTVE